MFYCHVTLHHLKPQISYLIDDFCANIRSHFERLSQYDIKSVIVIIIANVSVFSDLMTGNYEPIYLTIYSRWHLYTHFTPHISKIDWILFSSKNAVKWQHQFTRKTMCNKLLIWLHRIIRNQSNGTFFISLFLKHNFNQRIGIA